MDSEEIGAEADVLPSYEELMTWKKNAMVDWLSNHKKPKSGTKAQLATRIYRAMHEDSSPDTGSGTDSEPEAQPDTATLPAPQSLQSGWQPVSDVDMVALQTKDIENYFVHHKNPTTGREGNFQRQLGKAKKLANEKHVTSLNVHTILPDCNVLYIKARCVPSMRQNVRLANGMTVQEYTQYVTVSKASSFILAAKCNCKAGACGLCAHVGACLIVLSRTTTPSCTSSACVWTRPSMKKETGPRRWQDINFVNTENKTPGAQSVKPYPGVYRAGPCADPDKFLTDMLKGLEEVNPTCVLFSTLCAGKDNISDFMKSFELNFCLHDGVNLNTSFSQSLIDCFISNLHSSVTQEVCLQVNTATIGQHNNRNWDRVRTVLITSSNFGVVCKRKATTPPDNFIKVQRGYTTLPPGIRGIEHGRHNEPKARKLYAQHHREQCKVPVSVVETGININPAYPYLGTSVDGVVDCAKCGKGILEIKCPYGTKEHSWRDMEVDDCCAKKAFFCSTDSDGKIKLDSTHNYFYQVMGQLALTSASYCDFVVYTKKGLACQRIVLDADLWVNMHEKLQNFYRHMVAEILSQRIRRGKQLY